MYVDDRVVRRQQDNASYETLTPPSVPVRMPFFSVTFP